MRQVRRKGSHRRTHGERCAAAGTAQTAAVCECTCAYNLLFDLGLELWCLQSLRHLQRPKTCAATVSAAALQKNRKIAVSPMPVPKALAPGRSKAPAAAKAAKPAAVAPAAAPSAAAAAAGLSAATGAARPARARKPAVVYVESDDDDVMVLSDDSGSDYAASD